MCPVLFAIGSGKPEAIQATEWLLDHGASLDVENIYGNTPLLIAVTYEQFNEMDWLIARGAFTKWKRNQTGYTALLCAADVGKRKVLPWLPAWGCLRGIHIYYAGNKAVMKRLLELGADIADRSDDGTNVLLAACYSGSVDMVDWLHTEHGLSLDVTDNDHTTPVIAAARRGATDLISYLIGKGKT